MKIGQLPQYECGRLIGKMPSIKWWDSWTVWSLTAFHLTSGRLFKVVSACRLKRIHPSLVTSYSIPTPPKDINQITFKISRFINKTTLSLIFCAHSSITHTTLNPLPPKLFSRTSTKLLTRTLSSQLPLTKFHPKHEQLYKRSILCVRLK